MMKMTTMTRTAVVKRGKEHAHDEGQHVVAHPGNQHNRAHTVFTFPADPARPD